MKVFILTNVHTPNERGATGHLSAMSFFKTYEDAFAKLKEEMDKDWVDNGEKRYIEHKARNNPFETGEKRLRALWSYECYIDGLDGHNSWEINECEIPE